MISAKVKEKEATVLYSLEKLIHVGLAEKKKCITEEKNRKKTQYVLKDHMFKFWYMFVPKAHSVIEMGQGGFYYEKVVKPQLHFFMSSVFEDMCRYFTLEQGIAGRFGNFMTQAGTWWGVETIPDQNGRKMQQSADIDVVAISDLDKTAVIGECKFKKEKTDQKIYDTLIRRGALLSGKYRVVKYLFFSLGGYTEWFDALQDESVMLFTLEDLYAETPCEKYIG